MYLWTRSGQQREGQGGRSLVVGSVSERDWRAFLMDGPDALPWRPDAGGGCRGWSRRGMGGMGGMGGMDRKLETRGTPPPLSSPLNVLPWDHLKTCIKPLGSAGGPRVAHPQIRRLTGAARPTNPRPAREPLQGSQESQRSRIRPSALPDNRMQHSSRQTSQTTASPASLMPVSCQSTSTCVVTAVSLRDAYGGLLILRSESWPDRSQQVTAGRSSGLQRVTEGHRRPQQQKKKHEAAAEAEA